MTYKQVEKIARSFEKKHPKSFFAIDLKEGKILCHNRKMRTVAQKVRAIKEKNGDADIMIRINPSNIPAISIF